jgi:hypothetical protein
MADHSSTAPSFPSAPPSIMRTSLPGGGRTRTQVMMRSLPGGDGCAPDPDGVVPPPPRCQQWRHSPLPPSRPIHPPVHPPRNMRASLEVLKVVWGWCPAVGGGCGGSPVWRHDWAMLGALSPSSPACVVANGIRFNGGGGGGGEATMLADILSSILRWWGGGQGGVG